MGDWLYCLCNRARLSKTQPKVLLRLLFDGLVFPLREGFTEQNVIGLDSNNVTAAAVRGTSFRGKLHLWLSGPWQLCVFYCAREYCAAPLSYFYCDQCKRLEDFTINTQLCADVCDKIQPVFLLNMEMNTFVLFDIVFVCLQLASGIYSFACSLWSHHTDCFLQQIYARDEATALGSLERTLLSLKGIRCIYRHPAVYTIQDNNVLMATNNLLWFTFSAS